MSNEKGRLNIELGRLVICFLHNNKDNQKSLRQELYMEMDNPPWRRNTQDAPGFETWTHLLDLLILAKFKSISECS